VDEVVAAAIRLADIEGLASVTLRRLGSDLGMTAMSLYPYVGTKDDLVSLMQDQALAPAYLFEGPSITPDLRVVAWAEALYEVYLNHPWLADINWATSASGPNERAWLEELNRLLRQTALAAGDRSVVVTAVYSLVRACAQTRAAYNEERVTTRWRAVTESTHRAVPDLDSRYPASSAAAPARDYRAAPLDAVRRGVELILIGASHTK
jgi:AcrR family transcriptional regulator